MFRRLADYVAHKAQHQHRSCRRLRDSAAQTSPPPPPAETADHGDVGLAAVLRQSQHAASIGNDGLIEAGQPVCGNDVPVSGAVVVALPDTTSNVSSDAAADDGDDDDDCTSTSDPLPPAPGVPSPAAVSQDPHSDSVEPAPYLPPPPAPPPASVGSRGCHGGVTPAPPPPHQCPRCDFTSKFRDDFDQHLRRQHAMSAHVCVGCARAYADAYKLRRHQRLHCKKTPLAGKRPPQQPGPPQQQPGPPAHQPGPPQQHPGPPQEQPGPPRFVALDRRRKTAAERGGGVEPATFRCEMCTDTFTDYDAVRSHVTAEHAALARPGICRFCGAWFANPYRLRRHVTSSLHDDVPADAMAAFKRLVDRMTISCTPEAMRLLRRARAERRRAAQGGTECRLCGRAFSARSALLRHTRLVHGRRTEAPPPSISCQPCGASFDRRRAYLRHRRDAHRRGQQAVVRGRPTPADCPVCARRFKRPDAAVRHRAAVHAARQQLPDDHASPDDQPDASSAAATHACFVCAEASSSRRDQARHLDLFHRVWVALPDGPVPSTLFDDVPPVPPSLRHADDALPTAQRGTSRLPPGGQSPSQQAASPWACAYCGQSFDALDELCRHKVDAHRLTAAFRCVACRAEFGALAQYEDHVTGTGHRQAAFICATCNEHCADASSLQSHRVSAHQVARRRRRGQSPAAAAGRVLCDECGRTFGRRSALVRHRAVIHRRDTARRHACAQCERVFVKREHLQRHVISRHAAARPYVCRAPGCGRAFKRKDKLQEHYRCHSADRAYTCATCGRTYRQRCGLRAHERRAHRGRAPPPPGTARSGPERRRSCRRCVATFARARKLAEHMQRAHGRGAGKDQYAHRCSTCGKTFPRPERVRRHAERAHNAAVAWSHRCAVCGRGFAGQRSHDVHVARHHAQDGASTRRSRRPTDAKTTTATTTEASPPVVVVTRRHESGGVAAAACDARRRQTTDVAAPTFNRFFVASTPPSGRHHQRPPDQSSSQCRDDTAAYRRIAFEPLPYLHHPANTHAHRHPAPHRLYPAAPAGLGYASPAAAGPRASGLFPAADHTAAAAALPFGVQSAESCFGGQSVDRRPEFSGGGGLVNAFPSVMAAGDNPGGGAGSSSAPLRPLATQPAAAGAYYPAVVPDPPSVGRWFDSVPTLLPAPVDPPSLDAVRWPPCIDPLPAVRPRYPFSMHDQGPSARSHGHQLSASRPGSASVSAAGWTSSCLLACSHPARVDSRLMVLGPSRRPRDADTAPGGDTTSAGSGVPPHGMLPLLPPPW